MSKAGLIGVIALLITAGLQPLLISVFGHRIVDVPNSRSSHLRPTPRAGGLGILPGLLPALAFPGTLVALIAAWLMGLVGLRDDVKPLAAMPRLITQLAVCAVAVAVLIEGRPVWLIAGLTLLAVGYLNAFNFMDGVNGISALNALVIGAGYLSAGVYYESSVGLGMGAVLLGTAAGFLPYNVTGRIFLGDVGSYSYGAAISITAIAAGVQGVPWPILVGPLLIYYVDTGYTLARRLARGDNPLNAHREHVYQRLTALGCSHLQSAVLNAGFAVITLLAGWLIALGEWPGWPLAIVTPIIYVCLPAIATKRTRVVRDDTG